MSELEVDISNDNGEEPSSTRNASQNNVIMSPYFLAQSITLPETRAIPSTSSNIGTRRSSNINPSNISSSISTTSFSDVSLYDNHNSNPSPDERIPTSFRSKSLKCQSQTSTDTPGNRAITPSNALNPKENCCSDKQVITSPLFVTSNKASSRRKEHVDEDSSSPSISSGASLGLPENKSNKTTNINGHSKGTTNSNSALRSLNSTFSSSSFWDQKVERMYL